MFRRKTTETPAEPTPVKTNGKGRPTPSRKEAEAAAKQRAKLPRDRKALAKHQRELRMESSRKMREALKSGDEAYLPARDRGPVRRFVRDFIDTRLNISELLAPLLILILIISTGVFGANSAAIANTLWMATILLVVIDVFWLRFRVRRAVRQRFPEEPLKGITWYAVMRAVNMRFLRLPKPQVKIGQPLPEHYR
ncbi:DUF3043 domain-containing protein [Nocardioides daejeonensis]|uniref:DUF3043 domain-containing protein n=1 Tax=Nocardioides daejeonensis TaxID=1046556 RepID=UPI000D748C30|nr:DUF3043 domain-containing protein [Nocardioides daejeonensis]